MCESGRIRTYSAVRQRGYSPSQIAISGALPNKKLSNPISTIKECWYPHSLIFIHHSRLQTATRSFLAYPLGFEPRSHGLTGRRFRPLLLRANIKFISKNFCCYLNNSINILNAFLTVNCFFNFFNFFSLNQQYKYSYSPNNSQLFF